VVGVNRFTIAEDVEPELQRVDDAVRDAQVARLHQVRASRDDATVKAALDDVRRAAEGSDNLLVVMREALRAMATVGEVCDVLRGVFGRYQPPSGV
jgi:methylmalonyl-CoA mutase N-terminal domain/subunit